MTTELGTQLQQNSTHRKIGIVILSSLLVVVLVVVLGWLLCCVGCCTIVGVLIVVPEVSELCHPSQDTAKVVLSSNPAFGDTTQEPMCC